MRIIKPRLVILSLMLCLSFKMTDSALAHAGHFHSLKELRKHIENHINELAVALSQKPLDPALVQHPATPSTVSKSARFKLKGNEPAAFGNGTGCCWVFLGVWVFHAKEFSLNLQALLKERVSGSFKRDIPMISLRG